jgi:tripartite-type tricarboxylate transporter receptor subunit TctC
MKSIATALLSAFLLAAAAAAHGGDFPVKPARIVVPIRPGSSMDIVARVLAQKLNQTWGQPVVVDISRRRGRQYRRRRGSEGGRGWLHAALRF